MGQQQSSSHNQLILPTNVCSRICINNIPNRTYYQERENKNMICYNQFTRCMNDYERQKR